MKRRASMVVAGSPEAFMIPVLQREIQGALTALEKALPSGASVLDIGCGNQPLKKIIEERGWRYKSLDIAQNDFNNVDFIGHVDGTISIAEKFDLLVCTEVLEHVLLWERAFENFSLLCKPGGCLLITAPFFYPLHETPHDYWRPTAYSLESFARRYDFSVERQISAGTAWDVLGTLLNSLYITSEARSPLGKLKAKMLTYVLSYLKKQLAKGGLDSYARAEGNWYLSNVLILRNSQST